MVLVTTNPPFSEMVPIAISIWLDTSCRNKLQELQRRLSAVGLDSFGAEYRSSDIFPFVTGKRIDFNSAVDCGLTDTLYLGALSSRNASVKRLDAYLSKCTQVDRKVLTSHSKLVNFLFFNSSIEKAGFSSHSIVRPPYGPDVLTRRIYIQRGKDILLDEDFIWEKHFPLLKQSIQERTPEMESVDHDTIVNITIECLKSATLLADKEVSTNTSVATQAEKIGAFCTHLRRALSNSRVYSETLCDTKFWFSYDPPMTRYSAPRMVLIECLDEYGKRLDTFSVDTESLGIQSYAQKSYSVRSTTVHAKEPDNIPVELRGFFSSLATMDLQNKALSAQAEESIRKIRDLL